MLSVTVKKNFGMVLSLMVLAETPTFKLKEEAEGAGLASR